LLKKDTKEKDVIILINDEYQDGQDVSWLWDVNFEYLRDKSIHSITATGKRCLDMCLRLKYEEIHCDYDFNLKNILIKHIENNSENVYLIVNYTGLYSSNDLLAEIQKSYEGGEK
jgi:UDP-N-acetylmuramyl tripeptide synthase